MFNDLNLDAQKNIESFICFIFASETVSLIFNSP